MYVTICAMARGALILAALATLVLAGCTFHAGPAKPTEVPGDGRRWEGDMPVEISVEVSPDVARALHKQAPPTEASEDLLRLVESLGHTLEPMHPGTTDPTLIPFFKLQVPDQAAADAAIAALLASEGIEGAYAVPPAEPAR
jgi:hypothetical protein